MWFRNRICPGELSLAGNGVDPVDSVDRVDRVAGGGRVLGVPGIGGCRCGEAAIRQLSESVEGALLAHAKGSLRDAEEGGGFGAGAVLEPDQFENLPLAAGETVQAVREERRGGGLVVRRWRGGRGVGDLLVQADSVKADRLAVVGLREEVGDAEEEGTGGSWRRRVASRE